MGKAENAVTRACRDWLASQGEMTVRVQSGMLKLGKGADARFMRMAEAGTADLIGTWRGKPLAVECKAGKGKQSESQVEWQREWERRKGIYVVARSTFELEEALTRMESE